MQTDTLANCVYALRAEAGHSLSTTQGQNVIDVFKYLLKRAQLELWTAYQWPPLMSSYDVPTVAGQYVYTFPTGLQFENIRKTFVAPNSTSAFQEGLEYLQEMESANLILGNGDPSQSGDFPQYWRPYVDPFVPVPNQIRIWPNPVTSSYIMRFRAMPPLLPFIADADVSTLDAMAIVLFTAAELLARAKAEDAATKLKKAQTHLLAILGNSVSAKHRVSTLGSGSSLRMPTPGIDYVPMTS